MRPMERINLCVQRSFSDLITATVNFMKQEFVPFIRAFARDWFSRDTDHVVFNEGFVAGDVEYVHDSSGEL